MLNGTSVPYATVKLNKFEFIPDAEVIYLGHTTKKPLDMIPRKGMFMHNNDTQRKAYPLYIISAESHDKRSIWRNRSYNLCSRFSMCQCNVCIDLSIP
jgi:hypothetical protein